MRTSDRPSTRYRTGFATFAITAGATCVLSTLWPATAAAQMLSAGGLVIEMKRQAEPLGLEALTFDFYQKSPNGLPIDVLTLHLKGTEQSIQLPAGMLKLVAKVERNYSGDELIISADNYLFGASPDGPYRVAEAAVNKNGDKAQALVDEQASEMGIDRRFARILLGYDAYAADIVCGAIPFERSHGHPLPRENWPGFIAKDLQDDPTQLQFKKLFASFLTPPACVGQLRLELRNSERGPQITARPSRFFLGHRWDQQLVVLDEQQQRAANLPYDLLTHDIQRRWREYRKVFRSLDELSSIAEVLVVLRSAKYETPTLYHKFSLDIINSPAPDDAMFVASPQLETLPVMEDRIWLEYANSQVGPVIHSELEADIALSLQMYRWEHKELYDQSDKVTSSPRPPSELKQISTTGSRLIQLKFKLVRALNETPANSLREFKWIFDRMDTRSIAGLGLWLMSLNWLQLYCNHVHRDDTAAHKKLLNEQRLLALAAVNKHMQSIRDGRAKEPEPATRFLGIALGAHLLAIAITQWPDRDMRGALESPDLVNHVELLAQVHAIAVRELNACTPNRMLVLAHHRYLGYLLKQVPGAAAAITSVRKGLLCH